MIPALQVVLGHASRSTQLKTAAEALRRKDRQKGRAVGPEGDIGRGGTAIMTKDPIPQTRVRPKDDDEREIFDTARWCASEIPIALATRMMLLHNFYGVAGNSLAKRRENERWLRILLDVLKKAGKMVPVVCCMDTNVVIDVNDILQAFMRDHGFREAAHLHHRQGQATPSHA